MGVIRTIVDFILTDMFQVEGYKGYLTLRVSLWQLNENKPTFSECST